VEEYKNMIIKGMVALQQLYLLNEAVKYKGNLLDYRIFLRTPSRTIFCTTVLLISTDFNPAMEPLCS
jgi:hypothetical protein